MLRVISIIFIALSAYIFSRRRSFRYLSAIQQDEYSPTRFFEWYKQRKAFDKKGTIVAGLALLATLTLNSDALFFIFNISAAIALLMLSYYEFDPRFQGKIKLNFTERANKINSIFSVLYSSLIILGTLCSLNTPTPNCYLHIWLALIFLFQALPFFLMASVISLAPFERAAQRKYIEQATKKVSSSGAFVIGITGSFGKTSTKNALGEILQITTGSTFWPKKGINTLMGNTREIRQGLSSAYRFAIIEMGAYRKGSIENLCKIAPPKAAIITAIRSMHLERFGGEESIYQAKTELARAVPADGILVCNGDDAGARKAAKEFPKKTTLLYGFSEETVDLDCRIYDIEMSAAGSKFRLLWQGHEYEGRTALIGKPALSNVMAVFCMACALGANPKFVLAAISNLTPVDNRLSLEKHGAIIHLKDAYNSNPVGFEAALEVLKSLPGKRKILMTPGMIELGDQQALENEKIAKLAAGICDLVLFVGTTNRQAFLKGLNEKSFSNEKFLYFDHRDQALPELLRLQKDGDVILIENDLPDWYEDKSGF